MIAISKARREILGVVNQERTVIESPVILEWSTDMPTVKGMYRMFYKYQNGNGGAYWVEITDGGGYLGVANENYVEPLNEYLDDDAKYFWLGPLPPP